MQKLKIMSIIISVLLLGACGVTVRDKDATPDSEAQDLVVENEFSLPVPRTQSQQQVLRFKRLVLKPGAQFITNGLNLQIHIEELISESGTIATFKEGQTAADYTAGRGGGQLDLRIGSATGTLNLVMRGEKGGLGNPGQEPDETLTGAKGENARRGIHVYQPGVGLIMQIPPKDGKRGGKGVPGFAGGQGQSGGNSGQAHLQIENAGSFEVITKKIIGGGGEGGLGGQGRRGGPGGDGGRDEISGMILAPGEEGDRGDRGPQGPKGQDGVEEKICIETNLSPYACQ